MAEAKDVNAAALVTIGTIVKAAPLDSRGVSEQRKMVMILKTVQTLKDLRQVVATWRGEGATIAVVPTMGALHQGHLTLVQTALAKTDRVIVTIFVNPRQFTNAADLANYPRTNEADTAALASAGAHLLYAPDTKQIYPDGFATAISVSGVSEGLCGASRSGHFDGVATVVTKLFIQTSADFAFFGEKDFQQLLVVRRAARDLDLPIEIISCPTVREADGLAMSSRNSRLTPTERLLAPRLAKILSDVAALLTAGAPVDQTLAEAVEAMLASGFRNVDYLELRAEKDLQSLQKLDRPARLLVAAWLGETRLIDNVKIWAEI